MSCWRPSLFLFLVIYLAASPHGWRVLSSEGGISMNISLPELSPGAGAIRGAVVIGAEGHLVRVGASRSGAGQDPARLEGLPEISVCETRDRVRAAVVNRAPPWLGGVTVTVQSASLPSTVAAWTWRSRSRCLLGLAGVSDLA